MAPAVNKTPLLYIFPVAYKAPPIPTPPVTTKAPVVELELGAAFVIVITPAVVNVPVPSVTVFALDTVTFPLNALVPLCIVAFVIVKLLNVARPLELIVVASTGLLIVIFPEKDDILFTLSDITFTI